jgi:hypothetical protein
VKHCPARSRDLEATLVHGDREPLQEAKGTGNDATEMALSPSQMHLSQIRPTSVPDALIRNRTRRFSPAMGTSADQILNGTTM